MKTQINDKYEGKSNYKRIMVNTLSMYIRMIVLTIISLYTVRVVLQQLGASDYGTYNVVGGIVTMFSFVSGTLTNASQRYFAYSLANDDWKQVNKYFSLNMVVYLALVLVIVAISETFGLWFLKNKMVIDSGRMAAAIWVYRFSVLTFVLNIFSAPYQALLIAAENLKIYSLISVFEAVMKLVTVYLLQVIRADKLIMYAFLVFVVSILTNLFLIFYCKNRYNELKLKLIKEKEEYVEVFSFVGWNFIGSIASVCKGQGINIIINMIFNTTLNAARGIAIQVSSIVASFSQNFMKAIEPQITKQYALGNQEKFYSIIYTSSKLSFYLLYIIALPLMCNIDYVFGLWLGEIPDYTKIFTILVLIDALISCITDSIYTAVQSTGNIKMYQIVVGGISLLNLPVSWILLKIYPEPIVPFVVSIIITFAMMISRLIVLGNISDFSITRYLKNVLFYIAMVIIASCIIELRMISFAETFVQLVRNVFISVIIHLILIFILGTNSVEKELVISMVKAKLIKGKNK